jgi:hypothetical protein
LQKVEVVGRENKKSESKSKPGDGTGDGKKCGLKKPPWQIGQQKASAQPVLGKDDSKKHALNQAQPMKTAKSRG